VKDCSNLSVVTEHFPVKMINVPSLLQQLQDHWNPYILPVGAGNERD
jgi:hypothetical protein